MSKEAYKQKRGLNCENKPASITTDEALREIANVVPKKPESKYRSRPHKARSNTSCDQVLKQITSGGSFRDNSKLIKHIEDLEGSGFFTSLYSK